MGYVQVRPFVIGWVAAAVVATVIAFGTLFFVRGAVGGERVVGALSQADVQARLSAAGAAGGGQLSGSGPAPVATASGRPSSVPTPPTSSRPITPGSARRTQSPSRLQTGDGSGSLAPSPSPSSVSRLLTSAGGSVVATCTGSGTSGLAYLVSWSPAQGFTANPPTSRGPGRVAEIEFESDSTSVDVQVRCSSSGPVQTVQTTSGSADGGRNVTGGDG